MKKENVKFVKYLVIKLNETLCIVKLIIFMYEFYEYR